MNLNHSLLSRPPRRAALLHIGAAARSPACPAWVLGADPGVKDKELLIGQNISLQGGRKVHGAEVHGRVRACLDEVNRYGGVLGRRLVLRTLDDDNDSA